MNAIARVSRCVGVPFHRDGLVCVGAHALGKQVAVTTVAPTLSTSVATRLCFADRDDHKDPYRQNIQTEDLNMLNSALAVIRWKKLCGFYVDFEREHYSKAPLARPTADNS
jgi:hypothetical protein